MYQFRMVERWADGIRCVLKCNRGRFHAAMAGPAQSAAPSAPGPDQDGKGRASRRTPPFHVRGAGSELSSAGTAKVSVMVKGSEVSSLPARLSR